VHVAVHIKVDRTHLMTTNLYCAKVCLALDRKNEGCSAMVWFICGLSALKPMQPSQGFR